jgi:hypothetical protein
MTQSPSERRDALRSARQRRLALEDAIGRAERALAAPSGSPNWRSEVSRTLELVRVALDDHIVEVEAGDGLLPELRSLDPRFVNAADELEAEHPVLCEHVDKAREVLTSDASPPEIRRHVLDVLVALVRHRQRGADLVFEAYNVDIGGAE